MGSTVGGINDSINQWKKFIPNCCTMFISNSYTIIVCVLLILLLILATLRIKTRFYSTGMNVISNYSGIVKANSPTYMVHRYDRHQHENMIYRYERMRVMVSRSGSYQFECNENQKPPFVSVGTIDLYNNSFNPANLSNNRLTPENADEGIHRNSFNISLQTTINYNLVVSVIGTCEQSFSILITGPATVSFP